MAVILVQRGQNALTLEGFKRLSALKTEGGANGRPPASLIVDQASNRSSSRRFTWRRRWARRSRGRSSGRSISGLTSTDKGPRPAAVDPADACRRLRASGSTAFLCGSVENEVDVWDLFDLVVCLVADNDTIRERLQTRTTNSFGKHPDELAAALGC